jgi:hypothetical protein
LPRGVTDRGSTPRSAELWDMRDAIRVAALEEIKA